MNKIFFFSLCSFLISQLIAQPFEKKQITNFDYDSRGATFPIYPVGLSFMRILPIFFEAHLDNASNIMMMSYDSVSDSFVNPTPITLNNFLNINPIAEASQDWNGKINLIWQTNENGNWDIVMNTFSDSTWGEKKLLLSSPANEINPQFIVKPFWDPYSEFDIDLVYQSENSIWVFQQRNDSLINHEIVFKGTDSVEYSQPSGAYSSSLFVAATCKTIGGTSKIVYRYKSYDDSVWSEIKTAYENIDCDNAKFFNYYNNIWLSFERIVAYSKQVLIFPDLQYLGQNEYAVGLLDDQTVSTSDLTLFTYGIVGGLSKNKQHEFYAPHSYKIISNDSVYIIQPFSYWSEPKDKEYFTKVLDTRIGVGNLGYHILGAISYTIWEDSANEKINLFGVIRFDPLGDIKNAEDRITDFILRQNYPNPFNPKTMIKYELLSRDYVTLKVYDVLGKEIATLVNEEKDAGEYKTTFDGLNLASGIYVYRLSVGNHHLSRKMILLK